MAFGLIKYPVEVISGQIRNAFPGFKPIEVEFSNDGSPDVTGVEVVLTDPSDFNTDLLGFSLFADFAPDNTAIIDVSIITDFTTQRPFLVSQEIVESRIAFKIKYRPVYADGLEVSYTNAEAEEIIAVHSIEHFDLYKWLIDIPEPKMYRNYTHVVSFINSDANRTGVDPYTVTYDKLDISEAPISTDVLLKNYGFDPKGVLNAALITKITPDDPIAINNGGFVGTTDWSDTNGDGLADFWLAANDNTATIVTGNGFNGNAQRIEQTGANGAFVRSEILIPTGNKTVKIGFKYRTNISPLNFLDNAPSSDINVIPVNEGNAASIEFTIDVTTGGIQPAFSASEFGLGKYFEIDEVYYSEETGGGSPDLTNVEYIDFKINGED